MKHTHITNNQNINSLYILKAVCAFLVVLIHTKSPNKDFYLPICRIAVPIFFMISGYLMGLRGINQKIIKSSIIKLLEITVIANLIYFLWIYFTNIKSIDILSYKFWIVEILFGGAIMGHLWYLTAYIEVLIIIYFLSKINKLSIIYFLIPICILLNLITGSYSFILNINHPYQFIHTNFFTIGLPCFAIGMLLNKKYTWFLKNIKSWHILLLFAIAYIEGVTKHKFGLHPPGIGDIYIFTIPLSTIILFLFIKSPNLCCYNLLVSTGKNHSLNIYLYHGLILSILSDVIGYSFNLPIIDTVLVYIITIFSSILIRQFNYTNGQ